MIARTKHFAEAEQIKLRRVIPRRRKPELIQPAPSPLNGILSLHRTVGNRALGSLLNNQESSSKLDQPRVSNAASSVVGVSTVSMKNVEMDEEEGDVTSVLQKKEGEGGGPASGPASKPASAPASAPAKAKAKKAGVESFEVKWVAHPKVSATNPQFRVIFKAKFKNDADHDPALADFRQKVGTKWKITGGPRKGFKGETPSRDDGYTRADDIKGNKLTDVDFVSNDNPGLEDIDKDDVLDYSFTAEQKIIDTSQGNKVIEKRGPHTVTIKGKHPRTFDGLNKTFS